MYQKVAFIYWIHPSKENEPKEKTLFTHVIFIFYK